mmetsp:Transcript_249/g.503  ORF Transcript_249/g.503 Transcript_249/m.503 type:complete len:268 (+) Transcript_249:3006-3809(+)
MVVALAGAGADHARLLEQVGADLARLDLVLGVEVHREPLSEAARVVVVDGARVTDGLEQEGRLERGVAQTTGALGDGGEARHCDLGRLGLAGAALTAHQDGLRPAAAGVVQEAQVGVSHGTVRVGRGGGDVVRRECQLGREPCEGLLAAGLDGLVRVDDHEHGADGGEDLLLVEPQPQRVQDGRVGHVLQQHQVLAGAHHVADSDRELLELVGRELHGEVLDVRRRVQACHEDRAVVEVVHSGQNCLVSVLHGEPDAHSLGRRHVDF